MPAANEPLTGLAVQAPARVTHCGRTRMLAAMPTHSMPRPRSVAATPLRVWRPVVAAQLSARHCSLLPAPCSQVPRVAAGLPCPGSASFNFVFVVSCCGASWCACRILWTML